MNTLEKLEWITIIGATVLLFGLGALALPVLDALDNPDYYGDPDYIVKVESGQWYWKFIYPDGTESGELKIKQGEILIVPKGVEHRPHTNGDIVFNLLFEPKSTLHTGNVENELTIKELDWI